jgi:hypothetical protein
LMHNGVWDYNVMYGGIDEERVDDDDVGAD